MADHFERVRYQQVQNEKRQMSEFMALKMKHMVKVSDRRAIVQEAKAREEAELTDLLGFQVQTLSTRSQRASPGRPQFQKSESPPIRAEFAGRNITPQARYPTERPGEHL